ncbi:MAG: 30S ribosomal protein S1 [Elusimicrobia bacterium ADurb.Bin231]|nr:MAG: 30S ribosomal protein S1 [Elusimicrobia bacterium ADurb.Bin231]
MEEMLMENMPDLPELKAGQIIKSKVVAVSGDRVLVDLGLKRDGILPVTEFAEIPKVGTEIDIYINHINPRDGFPSISHSKAKDVSTWNDLAECQKSGKTITGKISKRIKGGFEVDIGVTAFLPGSHLSKEYLQNPEGKSVELKITECNRKNKNVVVSNKVVENEKRELQKKKFFETIKEGDIVTGKISSITEFGVFVNLGGIDGLLHINDISYKKNSNPRELYKLGDEIEVKILKLDPAENKIGLGIKQMLKNPWDDIGKKYPKGTQVKGTVTTIAPFGAFVLLEDGVEGLIHVSDISWTERITHPKTIFTPGQEVETVVMESDAEKQKISLSYKALQSNPYDKYSPNKVVTGTVAKLMDFGCIVKLEPNIHGFLHVSEISKSRIEKPSDILEIGDEVTGIVVKVEKNKKRIEISLKQYEKQQEEQDMKGFLNTQETRIKLADLLEDDA